jgi:hypothetical protein
MNAIQVMLEALKSISPEFVCQASHHSKKNQHSGFEPCPVAAKYSAAIAAGAIAAGEAELKRRQDAITAVEFWISCNTDKKDAYCALLTLLKEEIK